MPWEGHNGGIYHEGAPDCMCCRCAKPIDQQGREHGSERGWIPLTLVASHHNTGQGCFTFVTLSGNMLWDYDGWEEGHNGGIYHENAPDCMWGRCVKKADTPDPSG
jgi:hypothetical protein